MKLDEYAADYTSHRGPKCSLCVLPEEIKEQIRTARQRAPALPYSIIAKWVRAEGYEVKHQTIQRHFRDGHEDRP